MQHKKCTRCEVVKSLDSFRMRSNSRKHHAWCIDCKRTHDRWKARQKHAVRGLLSNLG